MSTAVTRADTNLRGGGVVIGRHRTIKPGARASAQQKPLRPGQVRCDTCGNGYLPLTDGRPRAHQAERYVSCVAVQPSNTGTSSLCEHGNYPNQRGTCCGTPALSGSPTPRPTPARFRSPGAPPA